jgi:hypothetical protein
MSADRDGFLRIVPGLVRFIPLRVRSMVAGLISGYAGILLWVGYMWVRFYVIQM